MSLQTGTYAVIRNALPILRVVFGVIPLSLQILFTDVPYLEAISDKVSPFLTRCTTIFLLVEDAEDFRDEAKALPPALCLPFTKVKTSL